VCVCVCVCETVRLCVFVCFRSRVKTSERFDLVRCNSRVEKRPTEMERGVRKVRRYGPGIRLLWSLRCLHRQEAARSWAGHPGQRPHLAAPARRWVQDFGYRKWSPKFGVFSSCVNLTPKGSIPGYTLVTVSFDFGARLPSYYIKFLPQKVF
jgi:hypothetical protein